MTLGQYLETTGFPFSIKKTIAALILFNDSKMMPTDQYFVRTKRCTVSDNFKLPDNVLELTAHINRMVKDSTCPNNFKNRFYKLKHEIIKKLLREGRVGDIYSEGDCYAMIVDGKYAFHQLKSAFRNPLNTVGEREYFHASNTEPFNQKTYNEFQIAALCYLYNKEPQA